MKLKALENSSWFCLCWFGVFLPALRQDLVCLLAASSVCSVFAWVGEQQSDTYRKQKKTRQNLELILFERKWIFWIEKKKASFNKSLGKHIFLTHFHDSSPSQQSVLKIVANYGWKRALQTGIHWCRAKRDVKKPLVDYALNERSHDSVNKFHLKLDTWNDIFRIHI